jgi:hypothetical protein
MAFAFTSNVRSVFGGAACLAAVGFLSSCSAEPVYTHVQPEDGFQMKGPITFTVRVRVDKSTNTVAWVQDAVDANGVSDRQIKTYGKPPLSACEIFDHKNWACEDRLNGALLERPEMKDGKLSRYYFTSTEEYTESHRFSGPTL